MNAVRLLFGGAIGVRSHDTCLRQCAEECLTYEADDRSTVDEIAEWLEEIAQDIGDHSDSGVESLLKDIIPVKTARKASVGAVAGRYTAASNARPRLPKTSAVAHVGDLLASIRAYNKKVSGTKNDDRKYRRRVPRRSNRVGKRLRQHRHDSAEHVPPSPGIAPTFGRQYVST